MTGAFGATVATAKRHNVERYFTVCHTNYHGNYRQEKLKAALHKQHSFFTIKPPKGNRSLIQSDATLDEEKTERLSMKQ